MVNENVFQVGCHMMPYVIQTGRIMMGTRGKKRGEKKHQQHEYDRRTVLENVTTSRYTNCQSLNKKRGRFACCEKTNTMNYSCFGEYNADRPVLHFHIYIFLLPYKTLTLFFSLNIHSWSH